MKCSQSWTYSFEGFQNETIVALHQEMNDFLMIDAQTIGLLQGIEEEMILIEGTTTTIIGIVLEEM
jgi:hypothetical protein